MCRNLRWRIENRYNSVTDSDLNIAEIIEIFNCVCNENAARIIFFHICNLIFFKIFTVVSESYDKIKQNLSLILA